MSLNKENRKAQTPDYLSTRFILSLTDVIILTLIFLLKTIIQDTYPLPQLLTDPPPTKLCTLFNKQTHTHSQKQKTNIQVKDQ